MGEMIARERRENRWRSGEGGMVDRTEKCNGMLHKIPS